MAFVLLGEWNPLNKFFIIGRRQSPSSKEKTLAKALSLQQKISGKFARDFRTFCKVFLKGLSQENPFVKSD